MGRVRRAKTRGMRSLTAGSLHGTSNPLEAVCDGAGGSRKGTALGSTPASPTTPRGDAEVVTWSGTNPLHGGDSLGRELQVKAPSQSLPPPPPPSHMPEDELDGTQWSAHNPLHGRTWGSVVDISPPSLGRPAPPPGAISRRLSVLMARGSGGHRSEGPGSEEHSRQRPGDLDHHVHHKVVDGAAP